MIPAIKAEMLVNQTETMDPVFNSFAMLESSSAPSSPPPADLVKDLLSDHVSTLSPAFRSRRNSFDWLAPPRARARLSSVEVCDILNNVTSTMHGSMAIANPISIDDTGIDVPRRSNSKIASSNNGNNNLSTPTYIKRDGKINGHGGAKTQFFSREHRTQKLPTEKIYPRPQSTPTQRRRILHAATDSIPSPTAKRKLIDPHPDCSTPPPPRRQSFQHDKQRPNSVPVQSIDRNISPGSNSPSRKQKQYRACNMCDKIFLCESKLIRHMRSHTGDKPYHCYCGLSFSQNCSLKVHSRRHAVEAAAKGNVTSNAQINGFSVLGLLADVKKAKEVAAQKSKAAVSANKACASKASPSSRPRSKSASTVRPQSAKSPQRTSTKSSAGSKGLTNFSNRSSPVRRCMSGPLSTTVMEFGKPLSSSGDSCGNRRFGTSMTFVSVFDEDSNDFRRL